MTNPNYFSVDFKEIEVEVGCPFLYVDSLITRLKLFYPINNTPVGGGSTDNIDFKSRSRTNFTFPFTLSYNATGAQADAIISDLANKCGVTGGKKSNLSINYKITVSVSTSLSAKPGALNTF